MVTLIEKPTEGALSLDGVDAVDPPPGEAKRLRRTVQLVFQNPYGSLNPRKKVGALRSGAPRPRPGDDGEGRPQARALRPLSAHVLLRPAPAHRHRPRADAVAAAP